MRYQHRVELLLCFHSDLYSSSDIRTVVQGSTVQDLPYILQLFQKFSVSGISFYFSNCCKVWSYLCSVSPKGCQPLCTFPQSVSVRREALYSSEAEAQRDQGKWGKSLRRSLGKEETSHEIWFQDCLKCQKRGPWVATTDSFSASLFSWY